MALPAGDCSDAFTASFLLDVIEACLHRLPSEWVFLRELRIGTGLHQRAAQRLDAFALNCLAHTAMKRICYEVKTSRADFLCELKQPVKRRMGLRYSNEFYFVTPAELIDIAEVPIECGLVEVGTFAPDPVREPVIDRVALAHFDPQQKAYCRITVPAPWRETPGPTWQLVAGMLRHQQRTFHGRQQPSPRQQRLSFD